MSRLQVAFVIENLPFKKHTYSKLGIILQKELTDMVRNIGHFTLCVRHIFCRVIFYCLIVGSVG